MPTALAPAGSTGTTITLSWASSVDNVGVTGYGAYRNGSAVGTPTQTTYTFGGLACGTSYTLGVDAVDAAKNRSQIATVTAPTSACPDTSPPTAPPLLNATAVTGATIALAWSPSFDNVGVTGYGIYRGGTRVDTATATNYLMVGLTCGTTYSLAVDAYDAATNRSPQSTLTVTTSACPTSGVTQSIVEGSTIAGSVPWTASPSGAASKADFYVDGALKWTDTAAPFVFKGDGNALDTSSLADGTHSFKVTAGYGDGSSASNTVSSRVANAAAAPPPSAGYFNGQPAGAWSSLPTGAACAQMVHRSPWEPRPDNYKRNHVMPDPAAVRASFAARPLAAGGGSYDPRWDSWLLARVDGQFTGTTDEIFQWAACKWGVPDNVIRAVAYQESTWYQYLAYPNYHNRCVSYYGCGDFFGSASAASKVFCDAVARYGYDYQQDYGSGLCPQTFSILGIKSWQAPNWGQMPDNQNGSFPFNRQSTAFAADYYGGHLRGCMEGWILYLDATPGDLWGCVGNWFSGDWHDAAAEQYTAEVQGHLNGRIWLQPGFKNDRPGCSGTYGCPGPDALPS